MVTSRIAAALIALAAGAAVHGCGDGSGGGGERLSVGGAPPSGNQPPGSGQPQGVAPAIRLDVRTGASAPSTSLQDGLAHQYVFPAVAGKNYRIEVDVQPSGSQVLVVVTDATAAGGTGAASGRVLFQDRVVTPFTGDFAAGTDAAITVSVLDERQAGLTLSRASARAMNQEQDSSTITAFVHIAGDDFDGFGAGSGNASYGDLDTIPRMQSLVNDLLTGVNAAWSGSGVRIDVGRSGLTRLTDADVAAKDASLIRNGITVLDPGDLATNVPARRWGDLGIPSSDPNFGRALDVFLVVQALPGPGGVDVGGYSAGLRLRNHGGTFEGAGPVHAVIVPAFDIAARPRALQDLVRTLAHEMAHFLSVTHTTETNFLADELGDTPFSTASAHDSNGNGVLDPGDALGACPDSGNLMFPIGGSGRLSRDQGLAMRAYLSVRRH